MFLLAYIDAPPTIGSIAATALAPKLSAITAVALNNFQFMRNLAVRVRWRLR
jgi:hypothetical protein